MNSKLKNYITLLKAYNEQTNIYSKKAYNLLDFHINDCITLATIITNQPLTIFDFGSGSGLPAIPLAILNDKNVVYAIESKSRKTEFLVQAKQKLNLKNITIITKNIFEWNPPKNPNIITAKAFANLSKIETITKKLNITHCKLLIPISKKQKDSYQTNKTISFIEKNNYIYLTKNIT
tara:strand:+ start:9953 stop:10486 length:534 start_codon:yes stop_codon:yes gene_type:complete